jgi:hypothetical protein
MAKASCPSKAISNNFKVAFIDAGVFPVTKAIVDASP